MKVKLQRHFAYKYKDKKHYKHVIIIPEDAIEKLGWQAGHELEVEAQDDKLIIQVYKEGKKSE